MTEETEPGYRGKCLYKTGKCTNERALKTSGAAHNLCEEHRNRQNEHQRRLDAKNRLFRKEKQTKPSRRDHRQVPYTKCGINESIVALEDQPKLSKDGSTALHSEVISPSSMILPPFLHTSDIDRQYISQDFDGIVLPLPSVLIGQERSRFRARVYQKLMDYMTEEFMRLHYSKQVEGQITVANKSLETEQCVNDTKVTDNDTVMQDDACQHDEKNKNGC